MVHIYEVSYYKPHQTKGRPNKQVTIHLGDRAWTRDEVIRLFHSEYDTAHKMNIKSVKEVTPTGRKEIT